MSLKLVINTDGGARGNPGPAGVGVVMADEAGKIIGQYKKYIGEATNNSAEYQALIMALDKAARLGGQELEIRMDSELVVRQMQGQYKIKNSGLKILASEVLDRTKNFQKVSFKHVTRDKNQQADKLVNQAIDEASGV
ncbi:MAG: ribonuclease HI family protein [Candidatus Doudnabacteria bacterium]|nr:ribonuclease HI family protein [Candidatus Doudnabacteria bacterium]